MSKTIIQNNRYGNEKQTIALQAIQKAMGYVSM